MTNMEIFETLRSVRISRHSSCEVVHELDNLMYQFFM
jgi:hypothetical protein